MTKDHVLGAFLTGLGIVGAALTAQVPSSTFTDDPGPHLFPYFACTILILCGIGIALTANSRARATAAENDPATETDTFMTLPEVKRSAVLMALFTVYGVALWLIGFHAATLVMTFVFYAVIAGRQKLSLWRGAIYAAATYGALYLLFITFLQSYLPEGQFF